MFYVIIYLGLKRDNAYLFFGAYTLLEAVSLVIASPDYAAVFWIVFAGSNLSLFLFYRTFYGWFKNRTTLILSLGIAGLPVALFPFHLNRPEAFFFISAWLYYAVTLMLCAFTSLRALNRKKDESQLLFTATALVFVLNFLFISESFLTSSVIAASSILILAVTYTVLQDIKNQRDLVKSLQTKAVHLENEMLKRFIQPHFLLNTLTIMSEWIEAKPELATRQIELLSKEFRYITRVSGQTLISLKEELDICQVHLDIFNMKQGSNFTLETESVDSRMFIPPMVFHTLVENGLTHSGGKAGLFRLSQTQAGSTVHFRFTTSPLGTHKPKTAGVGLAYVESRLEQAFAGQWTLTSEAGNNEWVTTLEIPAVTS